MRSLPALGSTQLRFGSLSAADQAQIAQSSITELDAIAERLLTARSTQEALETH